MEFNEKIYKLRKQKGITQEELADSLFVSRAAVSKWESGRGYPNIDSLKAIAKFFGITVDELLSGEELLTIAEEDTRQKKKSFSDLIFGLLDCSFALFFFLPLFRQKNDSVLQAVSLLSLADVEFYLEVLYLVAVVLITGFGVVTLALQNCLQSFWVKNKSKISLSLNVIAILLFIAGLQPYASAFALAFLTIKMIISAKRQ